MLDLNPVYNYYSTVYTPKSQSKYDSHKRSELKTVYQNMVKANVKSPLFKVRVNASTQNYAIGLKSAAIGLQHFAEFLSDKDENAFSKLTVQSSDASALSGSVITTDYASLPDSLQFTVENLADGQINQGNSVVSTSLDAEPGSYAFQVQTGSRSYNFQLTVRDGDDNLHVLNRIANAINRADIGVDAYVSKRQSRSQLILESQDTGTEQTRDGLLFSLRDTSADTGIVQTYGLDTTSQAPRDAQFTINGMQQTSSSNNIAINRMVEVELKKPSAEPVELSFVPDTEDIIDKLKDFASSYNSVIDVAQENADSQRGARKLLHEVRGIAMRHHSTLEAVGLGIGEDGRMTADEALLTQSVSNGQVQQLFTDLSDFRSDLDRKTGEISLDPMNYVDQTVITYPNPAHTFSNPYTPSMYSGMLYNYYV